MLKKAILIGNSDGIGLSLTKELLKKKWKVIGISRRHSSIENPAYNHVVAEVQKKEYPDLLKIALEGDEPLNLCVYCAGIGVRMDILNMTAEAKVFEVNLMGMVKTAAHVIPLMVAQRNGHFIGLSSVLDNLLSPVATSYHASKAAFSNYLEGLALAVKPSGVHVTNVRFGFVDTKLAREHRVTPFMMGLDRAVEHLNKCIAQKPIRYTAPRILTPILKLRQWRLRLKTI